MSTIFDNSLTGPEVDISSIQGTGLGLSVCKSFVNLMNGTIECESKQGEGTTFTVTLPFRVQENNFDYINPETGNPNSLSKDIHVVNLKGKKILLVEYNELNRGIACDFLNEEGMIVDTAEDGNIAVEKIINADSNEYDLILMDVQMPTMNGYEATRQIRSSNCELCNIPIVAMTANAFEEDRRAALEAGMNEHVSKPIVIETLRKVLSRFCIESTFVLLIG